MHKKLISGPDQKSMSVDVEIKAVLDSTKTKMSKRRQRRYMLTEMPRVLAEIELYDRPSIW
jgi:hypothetical protein